MVLDLTQKKIFVQEVSKSSFSAGFWFSLMGFLLDAIWGEFLGILRCFGQ